MNPIAKGVVILFAVTCSISAFSSPESTFIRLLKSVQSPPKKPVVWHSATDIVPKQSFSISQPEPYFKESCANPSLQFLIPTTLNDDEYDDFIIHYWCDQDEYGVYDDQPTKDALVALKSESATSYFVDNEAVFGERLIGLGGASRKYVARDINQDGQEDFLFATNWEDGRLADDPMTNAARPALLMSDGLGRYEVVNLGRRGWGHAVAVVSLDSGAYDYVFAAFGDESQVFRYEGGEFRDVTTEYPSELGGWATSVLAIDGEGRTQYVAGADSVSNGAFFNDVVRFYSVDTSGHLTEVNYAEIEKVGEVDFISWNGTAGRITVIDVNGTLFLDGTLETYCSLNSPLDPEVPLLVGKMNAYQLASGESVVIDSDIGDAELENVNFLTFFAYDSSGVYPIESPILNEETVVNYNFYDCRDINGDALEDIVVYGFTSSYRSSRVEQAGKPIIYLNDGNGSLVWEDLSSWPGYSRPNNNLQGLMHDINNDGVEDLLLYGQRAGAGDIQIHLMKRNSGSSLSPRASINSIPYEQ